MIVIPLTQASGSSPVAIETSLVTCNATTAAFTQNVPDATACIGAQVTYKKTDATANAVTISGNSQTIDGAANYVLATQYKYVTLVSDGTRWLIVAAN